MDWLKHLAVDAGAVAYIVIAWFGAQFLISPFHAFLIASAVLVACGRLWAVGLEIRIKHRELRRLR